jgi:HTH-type transcriptional regulator/antitoxin HigA
MSEMSGDESTPRTPGDRIRDALASRGWTQADLARILGRPLPTVNEVIQGKRAIMPEMAVALGVAFGEAPEVWMHLEADYRLSLVKDSDARQVRSRARLYEIAPVKEIQKRGWIKQTEDVAELEKELKRFFHVDDLESAFAVEADFRKSTPYAELTSAQRAWCARALQMGRSLQVSKFREEALADCERELRKLAAYSQETKKVPKVLASYGIRFVVIEPLQGSKIDGAAMWLDADSPVIAISMRYDRIDNFWFTVGHELSHIKHRDAASVDANLAPEDGSESTAKPPVEQRADAEAATLLVPAETLNSFIKRVGPIYSKERISQFANRVKIHPGIIVGQLQRRKEIGYSAIRDLLIKVRSIVTSTAVTDGWGQTIDPRAFT